jgi:hypothetical protein
MTPATAPVEMIVDEFCLITLWNVSRFMNASPEIEKAIALGY